MNEPDDAKLSERYRALGREEPDAALDAAILAAARRAVHARPGGARSGLRRWTLPVSVAAVVVLTVTLTLQMQRERPDTIALYSPEPKNIEQNAAREAPGAPAPTATAEPLSESRKEQPAASKPEPARRNIALKPERVPGAAAARPERDADEVRPALAPGRREFAADPAASAPPLAGRAPSAVPADALADRAAPAAAPAEPAAARQRPEDPAARGLASSAEPPRGATASSELRAKIGENAESPERWLERIVALRAAGREREADESFAEFRKRYPDYRISEELLGKVTGKR